ncbi:MAG: hypothetical protein AAF098_12665 [Pseudomonadota bacterium]
MSLPPSLPQQSTQQRLEELAGETAFWLKLELLYHEACVSSSASAIQLLW